MGEFSSRYLSILSIILLIVTESTTAKYQPYNSKHNKASKERFANLINKIVYSVGRQYAESKGPTTSTFKNVYNGNHGIVSSFNKLEKDPLISILSSKDFNDLLASKGYNKDNGKRNIKNTWHKFSSRDLRTIGDDDMSRNSTSHGMEIKAREGNETMTVKDMRDKTKYLRSWKSISKKAVKACKKACKSAYKNVCKDYKCSSGMKKSFKNNCGKECKNKFNDNDDDDCDDDDD